MNRIHHLRPLRSVKEQRSLTFAVTAAAHHFQEEETRAALYAVADALWLQHTGRHERLSDREMVEVIRKLVGSWSPETDEAA